MKKSVYFIEAMPRPADPIDGNRLPLPGRTEREKWTPYKLWAGDRWECEGCGAAIVSGTGLHPIAEHYQPDFTEMVERLGATLLQVNDC